MKKSDRKIDISQAKAPGTSARNKEKVSAGVPQAEDQTQLGSGYVTGKKGSGGSSIIYTIWNTELEVTRAVKLLKPQHTADSENRFRTEMKIAAKLHHPNIVEIYSVGKWKGLPYIEMEYLDGETLEQVLENRGALPAEICTSVGIMVGRALNYAHSMEYMLYGKKYHGIVHRDLKPANIMIRDTGIIKLMDFGIARPATASIDTVDNTMVGTLQYVAPEQLNGDPPDGRTDIYSLATVLYEMLTGVKTFPSVKLGDLIPEKTANNYLSLNEFDLKIPGDLKKLIHSSLQQDRDKRPSDIMEFMKRLGNVHDKLTQYPPERILKDFTETKDNPSTRITAEKKGELSVRRMVQHSLRIALLLFLILGAASSAWFFMLRQDNDERAEKEEQLNGESEEEGDRGDAGKSDAGKGVEGGGEQKQTAEHSDDISDNKAFGEIPEEGVDKGPAAGTFKGTLTSGTGLENQASRTGTEDSETDRNKEDQEEGETSLKEGVIEEIEDEPEGDAGGVSGDILFNNIMSGYSGRSVYQAFLREYERGNMRNAVHLYQYVKEGKRDKKVNIYFMRALRKSRNTAGLSNFFSAVSIDDGEFYLEKGMLAYNNGNLDQAETYLEKASRLPSEFLNRRRFRGRILYFRALCADERYNRRETDILKRAAMDEWFSLKRFMKSSPDHTYYKKADRRIRRLSRK